MASLLDSISIEWIGGIVEDAQRIQSAINVPLTFSDALLLAVVLHVSTWGDN